MSDQETIQIGRYHIDIRRGERVTVRNGDSVLYNGPWYQTLDPFFQEIEPLPYEQQNSKMQLAFDIF
ncbi:MAG: hypothetical protein ABIF08_00545 [Nanoarchaeota archaeon]